MATVTRQPFAPLDGTRLQTLTSLKNRQNGSKDKDILKDSILKPSAFILKPTAPVSASPIPNRLTSPTKTRRTLQPKSPAKLSSGISKSSPIYAPAGRSPTRSKRSGIASSRRRTAGPYTRVDPPSFSLGSAAPFSLDAALKGTIPGYGAKKEPITALHEPDMKASWFFDIHEDTPEQEMTNLLQHSTCVLDISSDEESQRKLNRDRAEGRDKENVPPPDDISQTRRAPKADEMVVEKERVALGEMNTADFYAEGCDETSVIFVPEDEPEVNATATAEKPIDPSTEDIDNLMAKPTEGPSKAAVLEPIEGTGESFELWESGSAHDEAV
ncbi:hypothetical protein BFJ68_g322 [Fusarium oxysporum]|uniref:Thymidylate kinase n=1 Tax=Fusarium oxysporum TaxID=5507 RepID=A0A420S8Y2_FUSOX|nr:hypothetical protein BFJ68_g322 [Fusarium oxysporum]